MTRCLPRTDSGKRDTGRLLATQIRPHEGARAGRGPATELAAALARELRGEVRADAYSRHLFASDASMYAREPLVVAFPRDAEDVAAAIALAGRFDVPVVTRGAGTSLSGQGCGHRPRARHLASHGRDRRVRHRGAARACGARRRAGGPQPRGAPPRARLRPGHLDLQPGHARRHDRQQLVGQPLDRLRLHGRPRARARGRALRRQPGAPRAGRRAGKRLAGGGDPALPAGDRGAPPRGDRARLPAALARRGRLPARPPRRRLPPRALRRGLGGHARGDHGGHRGPRAAAQGAPVRRRPVRLRAERDRGHRRRAGARRRGDRADGPHDPRPLAPQARVPRARRLAAG